MIFDRYTIAFGVLIGILTGYYLVTTLKLPLFLLRGFILIRVSMALWVAQWQFQLY